MASSEVDLHTVVARASNSEDIFELLGLGSIFRSMTKFTLLVLERVFRVCGRYTVCGIAGLYLGNLLDEGLAPLSLR